MGFTCPYILKAIFFNDYFSRERARKELCYWKKYYSKKVIVWKFWPKLMLYTSKESSEHIKFRFTLKKYDLLLKKWKNLNLKFFFSKGGPFDVGTVKKHFFDFSNFQIFFWKMASMGHNECWKKKVMKYELNRSVHWGITWNNPPGTPPRVE